jgi:hypothetical protein
MTGSFIQTLADGSVQSLPWVAHLVVALSLGAGLVMWISGEKVLKPAFALLGGVAGGSIGFLFLPAAIDTMFGIPSPYLGLGIGAAIGFLVGTTLFRFVVAASTGLAFAIAGLLVSATYLSHTVGLNTPPPPEVPTAAGSGGSSPVNGLSPTTQRVLEDLRPVTARVKAFVSGSSERLSAQWRIQEERNKVVMGVSALGAGLFGFFLSLFAPKRSTILTTALFGSALVLGSGAWLLTAVNAPGVKYLDRGPLVWLGIWIIAAILGLGVQLRAGKKPEHAGAPG